MDSLEQAAEARIGQVLRGKWKLERVLGIGGMATVYAASHRNGLRGAVKILHPEVARDEDARKRFLREGYAANRVERGAVRVLDDDTTEDGTVFLVMELLEGLTVDEMALKRPGERLEPKEVVDVALQLLDTLARAHASGIVHRDIKPENLFLTTSGELRVLDFGIARLRELSNNSVRTTDTHSAMGTPAFMPPEQALARWEDVGPQSDIYSVGATMFTLLSGELTHVARSAPELLVAVATKSARPLRTVVPGISPSLARVVDRALAHRPAERWPDASTMRGELERVVDLVIAEEASTQDEPTPRFSSEGGRRPLDRHAIGGTLVSGSVAPSVTIPLDHAAVNAAIAARREVGNQPGPARATNAPVSSDPAPKRAERLTKRAVAYALAGIVGISAVVGVSFTLRRRVLDRAGSPTSSAPLETRAPGTDTEPEGPTHAGSAAGEENHPIITPGASANAPEPTASASSSASSSPSARPGHSPRTSSSAQPSNPPAGSPSAAPKPHLDLTNPN